MRCKELFRILPMKKWTAGKAVLYAIVCRIYVEGDLQGETTIKKRTLNGVL